MRLLHHQQERIRLQDQSLKLENRQTVCLEAKLGVIEPGHPTRKWV